MKNHFLSSFLVAAVLAASQVLSQAHAQSAPRSSPISWHVDGGYSAMTGRAHDYLENGWIFSGGFTWRPAPSAPFALRVDGHFSSYQATDRLIDLNAATSQTRIDNGDGSTLGVDLNAVSYLPINDRASLYLTAGVGVDRRRIDLTQTILFGDYFCDPWYGFCDYGLVPGDLLVARESTTRLAWNGGVGIEFPNDHGGAWFIEATYHRIETPRPTVYVPIKVGLRF